MFRFQAPYWLGLLVLPLVLYLLRRRNRPPSVSVSSAAALKGLRPSLFVRTRWLVRALEAVALVLMVGGLARPQWGNRETLRLTEGINIVLAIDLSESMAALDFKLEGQRVHRLEAVKAVVRDFVGKRAGDRIGMIVFGSEAYTQMPLTTDYDATVSVLERLDIGAAGPSTALGDALGLSVKRLQDIESQSNIVILLTDGRSNAGELSPILAADVARKLGVKAYTIGVGTVGEVPFVVPDPFGRRRVVYQRVDIDEGALRQIADKTGGLYFHAEDLDGLQGVYDTIDRLEKTEVEVKTFDQYDELYPWALLPALALLLAATTAANTRYLEAP
jgi:Ca-activated chloride channel family protein